MIYKQFYVVYRKKEIANSISSLYDSFSYCTFESYKKNTIIYLDYLNKVNEL